jgi:exosortase
VTTMETRALDEVNATGRKRYVLFGSWILFSSLIFSHAVSAFVRTSLSNPDASHLILIPFISACVMFVERRKVFRDLSYDKAIGGCFLFLACAAVIVTHFAGGGISRDAQLSGCILALALSWVAGFALLFGRSACRAGYFSLLFLFLMIPLPKSFLSRVIYLLQLGSTWVTESLFDLLGIPVLREGFVLHLAQFNIEVAQECSGIRSSMALLVLALLVSHFQLNRFWSKLLFVVSGLLMMILKNGIRIATLSVLAIYVDPDFLLGKLHREGGIVFFALALLLLFPVLALLQRLESRSPVATAPTKMS